MPKSKKNIKVRDLKPTKDAKGGSMRFLGSTHDSTRPSSTTPNSPHPTGTTPGNH